jgi:transcriptional regulator with GAF, ATPase, and Fis domain
VDVRIIAATHRDLPAMVAAGSFREDLWYRLAIFPILIPPLRERHQDLPELAHHFARRAAARLGLPLCLPSAQDLALLEAYAWPGNVRELATVIERAAILGSGERLDCAAALGMMPPSTPHPAAAASYNNEFQSLDQAMAAHIRSALQRTQGRLEGPHGAARLLAINPHTLRARMRKLGINAQKFRFGGI